MVSCSTSVGGFNPLGSGSEILSVVSAYSMKATFDGFNPLGSGSEILSYCGLFDVLTGTKFQSPWKRV